MAITVEQANAVTTKYFSKQFTENVYRMCTLLALLKDKKKIITGGTEARFPINYRELGTAEAHGPREQISFQSKDTVTAVETDWSWYDATNIMWRDEIAENVGEPVIIDLMRRKTKELVEEMSTKMGRDLYKENVNGKGFNWLGALIGTQAFGGVDEPTFRSRTLTPTSGTIKMYGSGNDSVSRVINQTLFGGQKCTDILVSPMIKTMIEETWVDKGARFQMTESKRKIELGLDSFRFMGVDFVADEFAAETGIEGDMYGIDTENLFCYVHPNASSEGKWVETTVGGYPQSKVRVNTWVGQLTTTRRRTMFKSSAKVTGVDFN